MVKSIYLCNLNREMTPAEIKTANFEPDVPDGYQLYSAMQTRYERPNYHTIKIEWSLIYMNDIPEQPVLTFKRKTTVINKEIQRRAALPAFGLAKNSANNCTERGEEVTIERPIRYDDSDRAIYAMGKQSLSTTSDSIRSRIGSSKEFRISNRIYTPKVRKPKAGTGSFQSSTRFNDRRHARTLFVKNLPRSATREDVEEIANQFGSVMRVSLINSNTEPYEFIGRAFIEYYTERMALNALPLWNDTFIDELRIEASVSKAKKS